MYFSLVFYICILLIFNNLQIYVKIRVFYAYYEATLGKNNLVYLILKRKP